MYRLMRIYLLLLSAETLFVTSSSESASAGGAAQHASPPHTEHLGGQLILFMFYNDIYKHFNFYCKLVGSNPKRRKQNQKQFVKSSNVIKQQQTYHKRATILNYLTISSLDKMPLI